MQIQVFEIYSNYLLDFMIMGSNQVRDVACESYAIFCSKLKDFDHKKRLMKYIYDNFVQDQNTKRKLSFITFAEYCLKYFSREALQFFILPQLLSLGKSEDFGIKLRLVKLFPQIKDAIVSNDQILLTKLSNLNKKIEKMDNDRIKKELRRSAKTSVLNLKSKRHQKEIEELYLKNAKFEEECLILGGNDTPLQELYQKELDHLNKKSVNFC